MKIWTSPAGEIKLERYPFEGQKSHQAWDAADVWIVNRYPKIDTHLAIIGEAFGVLGTVWNSGEISFVNDSLLSISALEKNRSLNPKSDEGKLNIISSVSDDDKVQIAEKIFIRLPKSLEMLEIYVRLALRFADADTEIWLGGMDKRWNRGVQKISGKFFEIDEVFPFERHARWIKYRAVSADADAEAEVSKAPNIDNLKPIEWELERYPITIITAPGVFSASALDEGTASFIEAFPEDEAEAAGIVVDLGCGSGILGLCAAYLNPEAKVIFSDESYLAVENAKANFEINNFGAASEFMVTNGAKTIADNSVDLVLCNPPFHYQNIQTREPAEFLFGEAKRILKPGGTVQIVGNSHLGYHKLIKEYFRDARDVLRSSKFTVMRGEK